MDIDYIHYIILGIVQGLTEFLPVSSSAHLILLPRLWGWQDQGLAVDVAAHVGTLCAVLHYFRADLLQMAGSAYRSRFDLHDKHSRYICYLVVATIPVALAGLLGAGLVETWLRHPYVIATATIGFGAILWWADVAGRQNRDEAHLQWRDIIIIGLMQALALIPGTSRSGITMTAGLMLGLDRQSAARFSFLLSIPVILLAGGYEGLKLLTSAEAVDWPGFIVVMATSFVTAALTIHYFLRFISWTGMLPYVIYRFLLGAGLLLLFSA